MLRSLLATLILGCSAALLTAPVGSLHAQEATAGTSYQGKRSSNAVFSTRQDQVNTRATSLTDGLSPIQQCENQCQFYDSTTKTCKKRLLRYYYERQQFACNPAQPTVCQSYASDTDNSAVNTCTTFGQEMERRVNVYACNDNVPGDWYVINSNCPGAGIITPPTYPSCPDGMTTQAEGCKTCPAANVLASINNPALRAENTCQPSVTCGPLQELKGDHCVCKPGYFSQDGQCVIYMWQAKAPGVYVCHYAIDNPAATWLSYAFECMTVYADGSKKPAPEQRCIDNKAVVGPKPTNQFRTGTNPTNHPWTTNSLSNPYDETGMCKRKSGVFDTVKSGWTHLPWTASPPNGLVRYYNND